MPNKYKNDLGFSFTVNKNGVLRIMHLGKLATTLRGKQGLKYANQLEGLGINEQQQILARITGNYKRGNEQAAIKPNKKY